MAIVVLEQVAEETTVLFNVGIYGCREAVGVNPVTIRLVVLLVSWVVYQKSV
jgi:hypothetical protein